MSDLIDRQAAIDAVMKCYDNDELLEVYVWKLIELPPIQPVNNSEMPNSSDVISRQKAIDAFNTNSDELVVLGKENAYAVERYLNRVLDRIKQLPSIQPEPHWIPVTEDTPDEERECWITPKTTSKVYRGIFTRHYGECHRTGFICDDGFMWLNTALAWMYCEVPEPYKGVTT